MSLGLIEVREVILQVGKKHDGHQGAHAQGKGGEELARHVAVQTAGEAVEPGGNGGQQAEDAEKKRADPVAGDIGIREAQNVLIDRVDFPGH